MIATLAIVGILFLVALTVLLWSTIRDAERRGERKGYLRGTFDTITMQGNACRFSDGREL